VTDYTPTPRTTLRRKPQRGRYDKATVHAILDAGLICHIGYEMDGHPLVIPTLYWREGGRVYWHGSAAGRALKLHVGGAEVCFTVALLDGLILARSAFRHSVNYRSVMAFGTARPVLGEAEKLAAMKGLIERLYPGRWNDIRPPSPAELAAVSVLYLDLDEVSAKVRADPPMDAEEDLSLPVWAGVVPLSILAGDAQPCVRLAKGIAPPLDVFGVKPEPA
jgi:nitroimidazol reductase NimA-like FMN-containing flavoprotein (pyridoxamine 5'-phosphate oxidase superfamily)